MVRVDQAVIARLKKGSECFEVLVDCDKALAYREGKIGELSEALASKEIFSDVKKGLRASAEEMRKLFKSEDPSVVAALILKQGEIQLTVEHRNRLREDKRKQIVAFIHRNTVDAKTGLPHPPQRIEAAMDQAKVKIQEFSSADAQVSEVIRQLQSALPIKLEVREIELHIPGKYAGPSFSGVKRLAKVLKEEWQNDGSLRLVIEIPAGIQEEVEQELNRLTKGDIDLKILHKR